MTDFTKCTKEELDRLPPHPRRQSQDRKDLIMEIKSQKAPLFYRGHLVKQCEGAFINNRFYYGQHRPVPVCIHLPRRIERVCSPSN